MRVSFILATKDRPRLLPKMIASVLCQSDPHWELIVFDNGTTSVEHLMPRDPRVHYWRGRASGPSDAYNQVLSAATGDIVFPLADDDTISERTVEVVRAVMADFPDREWGYARTAYYVDGTMRKLLGGTWDLDLLKSYGYYLGGAVWWRKSLSDRVGGFDPTFDGAGDYELYVRFGHESEPIYVRGEILYHYNEWEGTDSQMNAERQYEQAKRIWAKYA